MKYRITTGRDDIPTEVYTVFEAANDEEARVKFEEVKAKPSCRWDRLSLVKVLQEEKLQHVDSSEPGGPGRPPKAG